ncbi:MAG: hypothetical protein HRU13_07925 [Phycisphaerales bacterium]|nr:hypothetical protein [Phycisphaerales bacterium]
MSATQFDIEIEGGSTLLRGTPVTGVVRIDATKPIKIRRVMLELRWETSGRGDRDRQKPLEMEIGQGPELPEGISEFPFEFEAPLAPASYNGRLIKLFWEMRVRLDRPMALDTKHTQRIELL